eukprot:FR741249.1.p2 GENE.FR741249.1~~FR741249.1.p2  ORF type:complete len:109 (+),score=23.41 FR741249.1:780-1106(+)
MTLLNNIATVCKVYYSAKYQNGSLAATLSLPEANDVAVVRASPEGTTTRITGNEEIGDCHAADGTYAFHLASFLLCWNWSVRGPPSPPSENPNLPLTKKKPAPPVMNF